MNNKQGYGGANHPTTNPTTMRLFEILWGDFTHAQRAKALIFVLGLFSAILLASFIENL